MKQRERPSPASTLGRPEHVHGLRAALAVHAARPRDILRVSYAREAEAVLEPLLRDAYARRVPCVELDVHALARLAESVHHEGVCITARPRAVTTVDTLCDRLACSKTAAAIALDRVANPHNLGAVVRSAAYFGADGLFFAHGDGPARLSPAAVRVAEGGAEHIAIAAVDALAPVLEYARTLGVRVVGTDARAREGVFSIRWPRPCIVVIGNEREGLSREVRAQCDATVSIPGSGSIQSLNASVAAGVVLAELARTRPRG